MFTQFTNILWIEALGKDILDIELVNNPPISTI